jgi:hypothetical protein
MQTLTTKFIAATDHSPQRIKVTTTSNLYKYFHWNSGIDTMENHKTAALKMMKHLEWEGNMIGTSLETGYLFIFEGFDNIKISN